MAAGAAGYGFREGRVPEAAVAPWHGPGPETDLRRWALSYALLAPNPHNLQPWIADLRGQDEIVLALDPARTLPQTDPFGRQIMMGAGAFLELLALAAAERGHAARIALFPAGEPVSASDGRPFARVRLAPDPSTPKSPLFAAIPHRRTERAAYDPAGRVTADDVRALQAAVGGLPVSFGTTADAGAGGARLERIRDIARDAWRIEMTTERTFMESSRLMRIGAAEIAAARDGITLSDPPVVLAARLGLFDRDRYPGRDSMAIGSQLERFDRLTASTPAYLWIVTEGNRRTQQIEAGRAYARLNLAGTRLGLAMHPNEQALQEYPEMADRHAAIHGLLNGDAPGGTVQMLARLGRLPAGRTPSGPAPRRGLDALLSRG